MLGYMTTYIYNETLINEVIENRSPLGLFLHPTSKLSPKWIAVDNSTGDAWTEEFDDKQEAIDWLGRNQEMSGDRDE